MSYKTLWQESEVKRLEAEVELRKLQERLSALNGSNHRFASQAFKATVVLRRVKTFAQEFMEAVEDTDV